MVSLGQASLENTNGTAPESKNLSMFAELNQTGPEELIDRFISRNDGLLHLLYSDVTELL